MSNTPVFVLLLSSAAALPGDGDYTTLHWDNEYEHTELNDGAPPRQLSYHLVADPYGHYSGYPGLTYDGISPPHVVAYTYPGCGLENGKCMCDPGGAGSHYSGGAISWYGGSISWSQELCDEMVANQSVSEESGQKITGPFYPGTADSSCASKCEENTYKRPSGVNGTMVEKGNVGGCYGVPAHGSCGCQFDPQECSDLGGIWSWNCWSSGRSTSRNATMCNAYTAGCKIDPATDAGCICTMPVIRPSGSSSLGTITKDHADELIANGTCKEWSYKCDNNCTEGHGCYRQGGCTCDDDKQTCDTDVAEGNGGAMMFSFMCGRKDNPAVNVFMRTDPEAMDHMCSDHGYVAAPHGGGGDDHDDHDHDDATTSAPTTAAADVMDSNCAVFSFAVILFLREFF